MTTKPAYRGICIGGPSAGEFAESDSEYLYTIVRVALSRQQVMGGPDTALSATMASIRPACYRHQMFRFKAATEETVYAIWVWDGMGRSPDIMGELLRGYRPVSAVQIDR